MQVWRWYRFDQLLTADGWISPGWMGVDQAGRIVALQSVEPLLGGQGGEAANDVDDQFSSSSGSGGNSSGDNPARGNPTRGNPSRGNPSRGKAGADLLDVGGIGVPGVPNVHSHAFQRALVGVGQDRSPGRTEDSFWTWREGMYRLASLLTPPEMEAIAAQAYLEMLQGGFTSVGEFHYLHHRGQGEMYDPPEEMALRLLDAARHVGICITLLPVFYRHGGLTEDGRFKTRTPVQDRFAHDDLDRYLDLLPRIKPHTDPAHGARVGFAAHSLRAVSGEELKHLVGTVLAADPTTPVHIHVAEQVDEVEQVQKALGKRPVAWLLENFQPDFRWCLVHATHMLPSEVSGLAHSGAVAGLCPTTEADLGDGIFPADEFLARRGAFGVGTDSNVRVDVAEELRLLELGQRLTLRRRNVLAERPVPMGSAREADPELFHTGRRLLQSAVQGGSRALGLQRSGMPAVGRRADVVVLDREHPRIVGRSRDDAVDAWVMGGDRSCIRDVIVRGLHVIRGRKHASQERIYERFREVMIRLGQRDRPGMPRAPSTPSQPTSPTEPGDRFNGGGGSGDGQDRLQGFRAS